MYSLSLVFQTIEDSVIYFVTSFSSIFVRVCGAILLGAFQLYADLVLTTFKIFRDFFVHNVPLIYLTQPISVATAYLFIWPAQWIAAAYALIVIILRPLLKKPYDNKYPVPTDPPNILVDAEQIYGKDVYQRLEGIKLHYKEKNQDGEYLMVFLHGFLGFWFSWRYQIEYFSRYHRTVAVDLRGYGESEKPPDVNSYRLEILVDDLKQLLDKLNPNKEKKVILVGHGWGGLIIYEFLLNYSKYVYKYVTIGVPPPYQLDITTKQITNLWYVYFFQLPILPELCLRSSNIKVIDKIYETSLKEVIDSFKYTYGKPGSFLYPVNYYRANFVKLFKYIFYGNKESDDTNLPPGLAIYGDTDPLVDEAVYRTTQKLNNLTIKGIIGGHNLHEDPYKTDSVNRAIQYFIFGKFQLHATVHKSTQKLETTVSEQTVNINS